MLVLLNVLLAASAQLGGSMAGGQSPSTDTGPGSHIAALAEFSLQTLKAQSNSLDVQQQLAFESVLSASTQVVAGTNYRITARLHGGGTATLSVFEQSWTSTLELTAASYSPSSASLAQVDLVPSGSSVPLDSARFTAFASRASPTPAEPVETADPPVLGGYSPSTDTGPGSHIAALAALALRTLKAQSNSLDVQQQLAFESVLSASTQVVAGTNYRITARLHGGGTATLSVFEQSWTSTLELTAASYSPSSASLAQVDLVPSGSSVTLESARLGAAEGVAAPVTAPVTVPRDSSPPPMPTPVALDAPHQASKRARARRMHDAFLFIAGILLLLAALVGMHAARGYYCAPTRVRLVEGGTPKSHELPDARSNVA